MSTLRGVVTRVVALTGVVARTIVLTGVVGAFVGARRMFDFSRRENSQYIGVI